MLALGILAVAVLAVLVCTCLREIRSDPTAWPLDYAGLATDGCEP